MAMGMVMRKKSRQPSASMSTPAGGPATVRLRAKMELKSAYCVALKRFWVSLSSSTLKAAVPSPMAPDSTAMARYMAGRFTPSWATTAYPPCASACTTPNTQSARPTPQVVQAIPPSIVPAMLAKRLTVPVAIPTSSGS